MPTTRRCTACGNPLAPAADPRRATCSNACKSALTRSRRRAERAERSELFVGLLTGAPPDPHALAHARAALTRGERLCR